ncbi:T9SS type A sorting domain-containing protein [Maribacter halichondriae]|uniref:T9SS type A sorting domain-containing protein n=1 Tax=Maribacter halichondriae TaxID=2980554 RepID=UPI0023596B10|nr:T9SS type A sorting domain-containing protein [Maribacter sp. Hal144]
MRNLYMVSILSFLTTVMSIAQNPEELSLFSISQLTYEGAFRLEASEFGVSDLNYSEGPIAYNSKNHSLFIVGHAHQQAIAEFGIPELVKSEVLADLNMVDSPLQPFVQVLDGTPDGNPEGIDRIGGLYVVNNGGRQQLLVNGYEYYDAPGDNSLTTLVINDANNLETSSLKGYMNFQGGAGHTSGWISPIPTIWQQVLEGSHITGQSSGIPIISRTSVGPSAFSFQMEEALAATNEIATKILMDFSLAEPLNEDLANETGTNDIWTHLSRATYGFIVPGTRTYMTLGNSGGHISGVCYKCSQDDGNLCGGYCPPQASDEYQHYWLWDMQDLLKVKNGTLASHEVLPYDYGIFNTPFQASGMRAVGGGSFDSTTGNLYLTVQKGDTEQGTYARPPVVVVYNVNGPISNTPETVNVPIDETTNIRIYPNPTSDKITVSGLISESKILLTDVRHKVLKNITTTESTAEVDLTPFSVGLYFISIQNKETGTLHTEKIVKR